MTHPMKEPFIPENLKKKDNQTSDLPVHTQESQLGLATTRELLDELAARNVGGQRAKFENSMMQANAHIIALRRAFTVRDGGLDYRTVD